MNGIIISSDCDFASPESIPSLIAINLTPIAGNNRSISLRYYIERDAIICVLVRDVVDISMELNEIKAVMTLAAEHGISINAESRGYEPALISYE